MPVVACRIEVSTTTFLTKENEMTNAHQAAEDFVNALNIKFPVIESYDEAFGIVPGRKFIKIVREREGQARSVFAFVEVETGKLVKAAGWKAPAKRVDGSLQSKYDLSVDLDQAVQDADRYGSFLYIR